MNNLNDDIKYAAAGATAGFIGQYIADQIVIYIKKDRRPLSIRSRVSAYISAITTGGIAGFFVTRSDLLNRVIISVSAYYAVFFALEELVYGIKNSGIDILKGFIEDIVVIYFILIFEEELFGDIIESYKSKNEVVLEEEVISIIVTSIAVYGYKAYKRKDKP